MLKVGGNLDFTEEALDTQYRGQLRSENFDRDEAMMSQVAGEINSCHPPGADLALDLVAFGDGSLQQVPPFHRRLLRG